MSRYVFIESRDPFDSRDTEFLTETAADLKKRGNEVTVFLVQNGVLGVRRNARASHIPKMARVGITLLADGFSLAERGIAPAELLAGVRESSIDALVELIVRENTKAIWH